MDVYAEWCRPCRQMDKKVFTNPEVIKLGESFVMIRLDITLKTPEQDEIKKRHNFIGAPTIIFFDKNGEEIINLRSVSYIDKEDFILRMKKALESRQQ